MSKPFVLLLGTCDTKFDELSFTRNQIAAHGVEIKLMDVGRRPVEHPNIAFSHSDFRVSDCSSLNRNQVIKKIAEAATVFVLRLHESSRIYGSICIGGSGGTSLGASIMRGALPVGFPKLIVSTVASGEVSNFVGETDITMMYSVVDIAGQNSILNPILENAAGMIAGAAKAYTARCERDTKGLQRSRKKVVAITMFGVTTPAVDAAREVLVATGFEVFVFHATGHGGRAMENLIRQHRIDGVLDLTTTELADELVGGVMSAGPDRLTAAVSLDIPQVVSLGALDIVNFGPRSTLPSTFEARNVYEHNPDVTLVRTSAEECRILGEQIASKLRQANRSERICVFLPLGGLSMIGVEGGPYCDRAADTVLFNAIRNGLDDSAVRVVEDSRAINDNRFSVAMAEELMRLITWCDISSIGLQKHTPSRLSG